MKNRALIRARARQGFTLVELMISLALGALVVSAAWRMMRVSSRVFNTQTERMDTDGALRHATEMLRRHITRAGFLSFRSSQEENITQLCAGQPAASIDQPAVTVAVDTTTNRPILYLTGAFSVASQVPVIPSTNPSVLEILPGTLFNLDFGTNVANAISDTELTQAFVPPFVSAGQRWASIAVTSNSQSAFFLRPLSAINTTSTPRTITLTEELPACTGVTTGLSGGSMGRMLVAPISTYRFMLESPNTDRELERLANVANYAAGTPDATTNAERLMLVRREIDMSTRGNPTPTPIPGTARVLLDFADDFQIGGTINTAATGTPVLAVVPAPQVQTMAAAQQLRLRSLIIDLVARGPKIVNNQRDPDAARSLQAGRRVAHFEVFMPNMTHTAVALP